MLALAVLLAAAPVPVVTSPAPEKVALTVYRDPGRAGSRTMNLDYLGGFALVTETRRIAIPAGDAVLRFEGVADGIVPVSAIVDGLPGGTIEKNRDARLLSPAALVDGTLGREVTLRRTDQASGLSRVEDATIIAGPANGVVLRTPGGIETLGCSGLAEGLTYGGVPADLSARPMLSVLTRNPIATTATVRLTYLASGFDWSASYVGTVAADGASLDLFAWLTLANGNAQGFPAADVQAVAGRLERQQLRRLDEQAAALSLSCYPLGTTTSDVGVEEIIVTARRRSGGMDAAAPIVMAMAPPPPPPPPEDLGDLKLYRVPEPVTVSPSAQKQVALLERHHVSFQRAYRLTAQPGERFDNSPVGIALRLRNDAASGLGIPLPAGSTTLYQQGPRGRMLIGKGVIGDTAKGDRARIGAGASRQVIATQHPDGKGRNRLTISNANPVAITIDVAIGQPYHPDFTAPTAPLPRIGGVQTWRATVPANGSAQLGYGYPVR